MKKSDWYGLGTSLVLHLLLLLGFGLMTLGVTEPDPIGFLEVEFGPISSGQPVQKAEEDRPEIEEKAEPEPQVEEKASPPKEAKPVNLAKQTVDVKDEETVSTPKTETVSPVTQNNPARVDEPEPKPDPKPIKPLGGGATDGTTGETQGTQGTGDQEEKTAPYNIEGLDNRNPLSAPLPVYAEKVNAVIKVRVTVDPQGRITQVFPLIKGNPNLERAVRDALKRWRFNPLPPNAPQENQTGNIQFVFRLE